MEQDAMNWQEYIVSDEQILVGKPVVKGTRLSVEFLLGLLGAGWTQEQVLTSYPTLTPEALQATMAFAADSLKELSFHSIIPASN
jgi:uncharacterized protein (DUF433 family)